MSESLTNVFSIPTPVQQNGIQYFLLIKIYIQQHLLHTIQKMRIEQTKFSQQELLESVFAFDSKNEIISGGVNSFHRLERNKNDLVFFKFFKTRSKY